MPQIKKPKKTLKKTSLRRSKTNKLTNLPAKPQLTKSTHDYYCCCAEQTKQGVPKGVKITQLTAHCKNNASALMKAKQQIRETEKKKILQNWKQIGLSLGKIIEQT